MRFLIELLSLADGCIHSIHGVPGNTRGQGGLLRTACENLSRGWAIHCLAWPYEEPLCPGQ